MIDFHSHILPNIDDGSNSLEQSINILKMLKENKVEIVAATPHFYLKTDSIDEFIKKRDEQYEKLISHAGEGIPKIIRGAEVLLTSEVAELEDLRKLCIENTNYILIEMPYIYWTDWVYQALHKIINEHNLMPIIAHIERYKSVIKDPNKFNRLLYMDVLAQVNASSIVHRKTRGFCFKLIKKNMCHIIASDTHDDKKRAPKILRAYELLQKKLGKDFTDYLETNAEGILRSEILDTGYPFEMKSFLGMWV